MEFRHPLFFLLVFLIPVILRFSKKRQNLAIPFSSIDILPQTSFSFGATLYRFLPWLRAIVLLLFVMALARPQRVTAEKEYTTKGVDIIISMDISGSMLAEDFKPENRLEVAKQEAIKFIQGRENDRIGLVVFARNAFTQCPLTLDYDVLNRLVKEIQIGMIADGTAIGMGLATAVNRLRASDAKSKVIILISDGANNSGKIDPVTAAELAKTFGIRVHTILIGRGGLVPFPVNDPLFGKRYVQAEVEIDEMAMKRIADITGGKYFRARDPQSLSAIYEQINKLESSEIKVKEYRNYDELFPLFLIPAILLLCAEIFTSRLLVLKLP
ncbi:MAG: VWA domain-containing protein [Candidatus Omnitrophica bacterium]|nr:VWA domain-containing protein [Candidatus Omnitrophota bacterium]